MYNDPLKKAYFKDVNKYPLLSGVEEREVLKRAKAGDVKALHKLVCCNQRFVIRVAIMFQGQGLDFLDLISEGNEGLIRAVAKYNLKSKIRFLSYAVWWIRQSIIKALYEKVRVIKLPFNRSGLLFRYRRLTASNSLTERQIARKLHVKVKEVEELRVLDEDVLSVETPLPGTDGKILSDVLVDSENTPEKDVAKKYLRNYIKQGLSKLDATDAMILEKYYGLNGENQTLKDIADSIGVSNERIRQRKGKALGRLKVLMYNSAKEDDLC